MRERNGSYMIEGKRIREYYDQREALIQDLTYLAKLGSYVFRGYTKQDQLLPNIIRDKNLVINERIYLNEFEKYGSHYFVASNPLDFLSYAQHYGLPTRLLDFSYNPFIALSFALFQKKGVKYTEMEDRDYYYVLFSNFRQNILIKGLPVFNGLNFGSYDSDSISDRCFLRISEFIEYLNNNHQDISDNYLEGLYACDYLSTCEKSVFIEQIKTKIQEKRICFVDANQSNQRIIMQQGLFLLPYTLETSTYLSLLNDNSHVIKINKKLRDELLEYLDTLGFNTFRLMPDLQSVCSAITQRVSDR